MSLKLIPPGRRKGNRFYLLRGRLGGQVHEVSTGTTDRSDAQAFKVEYERRWAEAIVPKPGDAVSFAKAAELYKASRLLDDHPDVARIDRLVAVLGNRVLSDIQHLDLVAAARQLKPGRLPATLNREVLRPAAAILHYAANNNLMPWMRVALFEESKPGTRAVSRATASTLVAAAPKGSKRLLLVWLFRQGNRISDALRMAWDEELCKVDLVRKIVRYRVSKTDDWREKPLHDDVIALLEAVPLAQRTGRIFPWRTRFGVYKWLRPLTRRLGVEFTPHMGRHSLGRWLNETGAGLKTIMETLDHKDAKSSIRYQSADVEMIRAATARTGGSLLAEEPRGDRRGKPRRKARSA